MILHAFTDGASRGNPGESGIGVIVTDDRGRALYRTHGYLGRATNNRAEYAALLTLLEVLRDVQCEAVVVHSDSELMVRQVTGRYKVKDADLRKAYARVMAILPELRFRFEIRHVPRDKNAEADRLANLAIDTRTPLAPGPFPPLPGGARHSGGRRTDESVY